MRGRKVINNNQLLQNPVLKLEQPKPHLRKRLPEVKSLEQRFKNPQPAAQPQKPIKLPLQNTVNDYEFERRQRQTIEYKPIHQQMLRREGLVPVVQETSRQQRNTECLRSSKSRQNYLLGSRNEHSINNSHQKIKLVSVDSKERPDSRSQNNSAKKRGIELTKTLLKRISGMYNDKDFQNRVSFVKSKEQTTGMTMSGRGVCDEYQISDFDIQPHNNHTFNTSVSNQLSFNDSGSWNKSSGHYINSDHWKMSGNLILSQEEMARSNQPLQGRERVVRTPQKALVKVRSCDLINTQTTVDSVIVGNQPPPRQPLTRRGQGDPKDRQRYLIRSKNKTMDQMSLKESMVVGYDQYYN